MTAGRPTKYKKEYCKAIIDFFSEKPYETDEVTGKTIKINDLPFLEDFAESIGHKKSVILDWVKSYPEFYDAYKKAKGLQKKFLILNGLRGHYNTAFAIFTAKNILSMRDDPEPDEENMVLIEVENSDQNKVTAEFKDE